MTTIGGNNNLKVLEENGSEINASNGIGDPQKEHGDSAAEVSFANVQLEVPERTHSGAYSYASSRSNTANSDVRRPAKWFAKHHDDGDNVARSRTASGASKLSHDDKPNRLTRRKTVIRGIVRRGRTFRKTMRAMKINEADSGEVSESTREGHALSTEQRLRMYVLREIVSTEEDYTKLLQFIVDVMVPCLTTCANNSDIQCITPETPAEMLSNIKEIHKLHVRFLSTLKEATDPYPYFTNRIGDIFLQYQDEFQAYAEYCTNFSNAQKISYQLEQDPNVMKLISEWMNNVASDTRKFLHLEEFLIAPVQRLCKYPLLLRELKKFTHDQHPDSEPVSAAMKMMEEVTTSVNESERRAIALQAIKDLDNACDTWEKNGCMTKQGFMTKRGGYYKSWNIRWFILTGYKMSYFHEPTDTKPLGVLDLTSYVSFIEDTNHLGRPFCFGIKFPDRDYYLYCVNESEKQEWVTILKWKFSCIDRSRRQAHHPVETVIFASLSSFLNPKGQKTVFKETNVMGDTIETASDDQANHSNKRRTKSVFTLRRARRSKSTKSNS